MSARSEGGSRGRAWREAPSARRPVSRAPWAAWAARTTAAAVVLCLAVPAAADPDPSPTRPTLIPLRDRLEAWTDSSRRPASRPAGLVPGPMDRIEAIHALAGGARGHDRCVTDLMLTLHRSSLNDFTRFLFDTAARPPDGARTHVSADGRFRIHYGPGVREDRNLDGIPDAIERIAGELSDALADFTHVIDWSPAPADAGTASEDVVQVYLVDLEGTATASVAAYTVPTVSAAPGRPEWPEASDGRIFLSEALAAPGSDSRAAVVHQVAHMIQMREALQESPWWHEASAVWMENYLTGNAAETARTFTPAHARRAAGIDPQAIGLSLESFLWPHYLSRSTGGDHTLLREIWSEMAAVPGDNTLDAMDRVLRRQYGTGLSREVAVFNTWNLFLGRADDGRHYSFGHLLPTPRGDATYENFPARGASIQGPLWPTGSALVQILGDGRPGGIRLRFEGGGDTAWDVALVVYPASSPGDPRHVPIRIDADGRGSIALPGRRLAAADLLIQHVGAPTSRPAHYAFTLEHDPAVPFDLMSFTVSHAREGAVLHWSTDGEDHLAGWNVYRSSSPLGPFFRVNRFLLPAAGTPGESSGYAYVDAQAEGGLKYYYQLEGVTRDGFTEVSHVSGVRLPIRSRTPRIP